MWGSLALELGSRKGLLLRGRRLVESQMGKPTGIRSALQPYSLQILCAPSSLFLLLTTGNILLKRVSKNGCFCKFPEQIRIFSFMSHIGSLRDYFLKILCNVQPNLAMGFIYQ